MTVGAERGDAQFLKRRAIGSGRRIDELYIDFRSAVGGYPPLLLFLLGQEMGHAVRGLIGRGAHGGILRLVERLEFLFVRIFGAVTGDAFDSIDFEIERAGLVDDDVKLRETIRERDADRCALERD